MPKQGQDLPALFLHHCVGVVLRGAFVALSGLCFAFHGRPVPTSANLFTICKRRVKTAWPLARIVVCAKTYPALPSMGNARF